MKTHRAIILILSVLLMTGLYAEDTIQDDMEKDLQKLDAKYLKAKKKIIEKARDDYKKREVAETKKGNLDGALEYRKKVEAFEDKIARLDFALKKEEKVDDSQLGKSASSRDMERVLGYRLSFSTRMREHKNAVKFNANGHYYKYFPHKGTWEDAQKKCQEMGGHLVTITSAEEFEFVLPLSPRGDRGVLIGWSDKKLTGNWVWVTGEETTFKKWLPGEPNNVLKTEYFGALYRSAIADVPDGWSGQIGFICEWPK